jgi:chromosome segregation protein
MEKARLEAQESRVRREGIVEQFAATRLLAEILAGLAPDAAVPAFEESLNNARADLEKLGQVNLAAIDELKEASERKDYLDRQFADVTSALTTLEEAYKKIDKETRTRFEDTFNRINAGLKDKFPKLFGGGAPISKSSATTFYFGVAHGAAGQAQLGIHSFRVAKGTYDVALVFSIFDQSSAVLYLDEVDTARQYTTSAVSATSSNRCRARAVHLHHAQRSHRKLASQLIGVTMTEPGCSRLVSVDVDGRCVWPRKIKAH